MFPSGQIQTVPRDILEKKVGKKLSLKDTFTTKTGTWQVIDVTVGEGGEDILVVEKIV